MKYRVYYNPTTGEINNVTSAPNKWGRVKAKSGIKLSGIEPVQPFIETDVRPTQDMRVNPTTLVLEPHKRQIVWNDARPDWLVKRLFEYGRIENQLDLLFDDIEAGKFGPQARTGAWFQHIQEVKNRNPKNQ